ncbi:MAG: GDYXXLXY domain-containing protein [Gemmatimonadota bacterium]|nr:GDYXXLXY domain-containing protein [Gemmatimonadota bacterium]
MSGKWLRLTLVAQIIFFVAWAGVEEYGRANAVEFLLETRPVDPRDLLSGHYMTLRYTSLDPEGSVEGVRAAVRLEFEKEVTVDGRTWPVWHAVEKVEPGRVGDRSLSSTGGWADATVTGSRLDFGIDRFYFSEARKEELNSLRGGSFYVLATLGGDGTLRVKDLVWDREPPTP